jgi:succinate dehydrogenase / fumarate reductase cytochrome b subunit
MCFGILRSSLGKKYVMAITGLMLLGFVVAHLAGNLQIFLGADWLNDYSEHLEEMPLLLWPARVGLLTALILHMATAVCLTIENKKARPIPYAARDTVQASQASRTLNDSRLTEAKARLLQSVQHL